LLDQDIKRAADEQLAQRCLSKVDKNGDLQVSYQAVVHEEKGINLSGMGGTGWELVEAGRASIQFRGWLNFSTTIPLCPISET
jgi:hypothetical protein